MKYVKRNFLPGRTFRDLADFNEQLRQWQQDIADRRVHGTTHEIPLERFAREAAALLPTAGRASLLQALRRERVVAGDGLVSIDGNRESVPWQFGKLVAEHAVPTGRHRLSVRPEHGPGATARNVRQRYAGPAPRAPAVPLAPPSVQVRDPSVYEQLLEAA